MSLGGKKVDGQSHRFLRYVIMFSDVLTQKDPLTILHAQKEACFKTTWCLSDPSCTCVMCLSVKDNPQSLVYALSLSLSKTVSLQTASSLGSECSSQTEGGRRSTHLLGFKTQELHLQNPGLGRLPQWKMVESMMSLLLNTRVFIWIDGDWIDVSPLLMPSGGTLHLQHSVSSMTITCSTWRASPPKRPCSRCGGRSCWVRRVSSRCSPVTSQLSPTAVDRRWRTFRCLLANRTFSSDFRLLCFWSGWMVLRVINCSFVFGLVKTLRSG